jgi:hypothetical protein
MGDKFIFSKNKGKNHFSGRLGTSLNDLGTLGFRSARVSLPKLVKPVQQSRALYRTSAAKVKRQNKTG